MADIPFKPGYKSYFANDDIGDNGILDIYTDVEIEGRYAQVYTVAKQGADFKVISHAIGACHDASSSKRYLVKVYPGVYKETIKMKDYVDVVAAGSYEDTEILGISTTVVTGTTNCLLKGFKVNIRYASSTASCIETRGMTVRNCYTVTSEGSEVTSPSYEVTNLSYSPFAYIDSTAAQTGCYVQIFKTASDCWLLKSFQLYCSEGASVVYRVSLVPLTSQAVNGSPNIGNYSAMQALYTYTGNTHTDYHTAGWKTYTPASPVSVTPNTYYGIMVESQHIEAGGVWYGLNWHRGTTSLYTDGNYGAGTVSESTGLLTSWTMTGTTSDFAFKITYYSSEDSDVTGITCAASSILENNKIVNSIGVTFSGGTSYSYGNDIYSYATGYNVDGGTVYSAKNRFTGDGTETDIDIASGATVEYAYDQFDTITNAGTLTNRETGFLDPTTNYFLKLASDSTTAFTADRTLTVDLDNANKTLKLAGNLTVESASIVNQDLTTDAAPTFDHIHETGTSEYLRLSQSSPQTITGGVPLMSTAVDGDGDGTQLVNKNYVDLSTRSMQITEFFHDEADALGGLYKVMDVSTDTAGTVVSATLSTTPENIFNFITPAGHPHLDRLPAGIWDCHAHLLRTNSTGNRVITCYYELYKCNAAGGDQVKVGTSASTGNLTAVDAFYDIYLTIDTEVALALTDRLILKWYATTVSGTGNTTVTMTTGGTVDPHFGLKVEPFELDQVFIPYSGATHDANMGAYDITCTDATMTNLTPTQCTTTLRSDTAATDALGSTTYPWTEIHIDGGTTSDEGEVNFNSGTTLYIRSVNAI